LQAKFLQVSSDGSVGEGVLYFRRPTQLRLEYQNPNTLTLITSRVWLYVDDKIAKSVQAIPLGQTPLTPLLQETVSFRSPDFTTSAAARDGIAVISMRKEDGDAAGQLDLEFDTDSWQLRRWIITDLLGVKTTVTLQNPVYGGALANRLFGVPSYPLAGDN
jgi:outer membrane lipoprotein-sorting protein